MKCAIYIRVSTDKVEQKQSIENQKDLFKKFLIENDWDLYDFYIDVETGTTENRKDLIRLLEDANKKKFDILLSKELSRLARNSYLAHKIKNIIQKNGIQLLTLDNSINTLQDNTENFGLFAWLYEKESDNTSRRLKAAFKTRSSRGLFKGPIPPYGYYCKNGKLYVKNDNTPDIVKRIFSDYLSGKGFDAIAKSLFEENIPSPSTIAKKSNSNNRWNGSGVRSILENPHYTGSLVQNRTTSLNVVSKKRIQNSPNKYIIVKNTHEPIISNEQFDLVQSLIDKRRKKRPNQNVHLFSNMLFCSTCGKGMHYKKNRHGYICGLYNKLGKTACKSHLIKESELENIILNDLKELSSKINKKNYIKKIKKHILTIKSNSQNDINKYSLEIENLISKKNLALNKLIVDIISKQEYDSFVKTINIEINQLESLKFEAEQKSNSSSLTDSLKNIDIISNAILNIESVDRTLLNTLIDKIEIEEDGSPIIYYKFKELPAL
ncbi:recombinase family protein [Clostridium perfringens]